MKWLLLGFAFAMGASASASDLLDVSPLSQHILLLHFKDGHVIHHKIGQRREDETVVQVPLDVAKASKTETFRISSAQDHAYGQGKSPSDIGRKSKGTDFAWHVDRWEGDHAVNDSPDHTKEHWLYLFLPSKLKVGATYTVNMGDLATNGRVWKFTFDVRKLRSEAVHVNAIGYVPAAPSKFGYVYHWAGDKGGIDFSEIKGKRFSIIDQKSGREAFTGSVQFRKAAGNPETLNPADTPQANFLDADVYECDFSAFTKPGRYVLAVDGVGCSWPFQVGADVYREPFETVAKGLYYNRSGIALTKPYTQFERPAPHHPGVTPGFRLQYSSLSVLDYGSESGTKAQIDPTLKGPLQAWGWYQDAGDWDSYPTHLRVPQELMLAYELNPRAFEKGELNLPESENGLPDILNEAAWLPRFCHRLRAELMAKGYGTGGLGLRIDGDAYGSDTKANDVGQGSWQDVDRLWVASGEDPLSTYGYAGTAAQMAICLQLVRARDPERVDWAKEARESYAWAAAHTLAKDDEVVRPNRLYAAAELFRLTGDRSFEDQIRKDFRPVALYDQELYGPAAYLLGHKGDQKLVAQITQAVLATAIEEDQSAEKRALRWGGSWGFPMLVGQQTTPHAMEMAVARAVTTDPAQKAKFTADLYTTCDYFLGTNALNQTWVTGLGPRHPNMIFKMDSWYTGDGSPHPGIIPYGPWRKQRDQGQGPWDYDWVNKSVYPKIDLWPGNERWFDDRCAPMIGEFTIHQNTAPAAAIFGVLCAASDDAKMVRPIKGNR